jgi:prepilin-type N-terminal cleavage/methylation domain-containing protein
MNRIRNNVVANGERARLGRSESRPRGSLLRLESTRRSMPPNDSQIPGEIFPRSTARIESLNPTEPVISSPSPPRSGGEGRGAVVFGVRGVTVVHRNSVASFRRRHCQNRAAAGFSLIEVIIAVAILSIALVGFAHGITMALGSSKESELQTTAALYAAGLIENLRAEGGIIDGQTEGTCGEELPLYRWTESISAAGVDGLHQVDVAIENAHSGQTIFELRTLLFERPEDSADKNPRSGPGAKSKRKSRAPQ